MLAGREHVILLASVRVVAMANQPEALEDVERPVHRRRDRRRDALPASFQQLGTREVTVGLGEDLDHRPPLRRPAQAPRAQPLADGIPRRRQWLVDGHGP